MQSNKINEYYDGYNEDGRLLKDQSHQLEFITTKSYLTRYLQKNKKLLDVGAGTGRYSMFCAMKGVNVTAVEFHHKNIENFQNKLKNFEFNNHISLIHGDGRDLSRWADNSFDIGLNMGPLYHLKSNDDKHKTLSESLRVLKQGGILFLAYINKKAVFYNQIYRKEQEVDWLEMENIQEYGCGFNDERDVFFFLSPTEMLQMLSIYNVSIEKHIAADGIGHLMTNIVNNFDLLSYQKWVKYHLESCEKRTLLGSSLHNLIILRKG